MEPAYTISSPGAFGSGELKMLSLEGIPTFKSLIPLKRDAKMKVTKLLCLKAAKPVILYLLFLKLLFLIFNNEII